MKRYILISNIPNESIDEVIIEIKKKKKIELDIVKRDQEEGNCFNTFPPDFGFILSTNCDEKKYESVLNMNNAKVRSYRPIIIAFPENFNDNFGSINIDFLSKNYSDRILDLSNLAKKVNNHVNFNSISFAQTLYFLCYKFQITNNNFINELNLSNNEIDKNGLAYFSDLRKLFFPYLKKVCMLTYNFKLPDVDYLLSKEIEYQFYGEYIPLLARQTDLTEEAIIKFIEDHNLQGCNMPEIANEIHKSIDLFKESDYNSIEAFQLHMLKTMK